MGGSEAPSDLKFVSLFFAALFLYLLFANAPSLASAIKLLLLSIPISAVGMGIYALCDRIFDKISFKWPKHWSEWLVLYFVGLIIGGLVTLPVRLLLGHNGA